MIDGYCSECGAKEQDGLSCLEQFEYLLVWEHDDPDLYALHFWTVSNYMLQHPSNFTREGYQLTKSLFVEAYDNNWETPYILKRNRELTTNKPFKITNPTPLAERMRVLRTWSMTVNDVYAAGEMKAIESIKKWRTAIRAEL